MTDKKNFQTNQFLKQDFGKFKIYDSADICQKGNVNVDNTCRYNIKALRLGLFTLTGLNGQKLCRNRQRIIQKILYQGCYSRCIPILSLLESTTSGANVGHNSHSYSIFLVNWYHPTFDMSIGYKVQLFWNYHLPFFSTIYRPRVAHHSVC